MYPDDFESIMGGFSAQRFGSFRINSLQSTAEEVLEEFEKKEIEVISFEPIGGVFLFDPKFQYAVRGTAAFYEGKIYLQSIASMLPVLALAPQKDQLVLDVCAAPGGKTTQIAAMTNNGSKIIALEKNKIRCDKLRHNCSLQGASSVRLYKTDALSFFDEKKSMVFDSIILDAPCSAEGRISLENEKTYGFWSEENIEKKAALQYDLLKKSVQKLKKGGALVYSTCTLAPEENEGVVSRILEEYQGLFLEGVSFFDAEYMKTGIAEWNGETFPEHEKMVRILPSQYTEGFFIAKIVKR